MIRILPRFYALSATGSTKGEHLPSVDRVYLNYGSSVAWGLIATEARLNAAQHLGFAVKNDTLGVVFFYHLARR